MTLLAPASLLLFTVTPPFKPLRAALKQFETIQTDLSASENVSQ